MHTSHTCRVCEDIALQATRLKCFKTAECVPGTTMQTTILVYIAEIASQLAVKMQVAALQKASIVV